MKIAFISTRNAIRSIVAEAVARKISKLGLLSPEIYSAGVEPAESVPQEVIEVLSERGYSTENLYSKPVSSINYDNMDILITLSPEARDACPYSINHKRREHWVIEEPKSLRREEVLSLVEQVESLLKELFKIS